MKLGAFSVSLNVRDIKASKSFYENLGFTVFGGDIEMSNWLWKMEIHSSDFFRECLRIIFWPSTRAETRMHRWWIILMTFGKFKKISKHGKEPKSRMKPQVNGLSQFGIIIKFFTEATVGFVLKSLRIGVRS